MGHIQTEVGGVVRGGSRQSRWNTSGQKSHDTRGPVWKSLEGVNYELLKQLTKLKKQI